MQIKLGIALVAAIIAVTGPVRADLQYAVAGDDLYRVESGAGLSRISYSGTERLTIRRSGKELRFSARAHYTRLAGTTKSATEAFFVQVLTEAGWFEDRIDDDPDFLTVLNQPFAMRLDAATLRDLRSTADSRAVCRKLAAGRRSRAARLSPARRRAAKSCGHPTAAVRFEADGPMSADAVAGPPTKMSAATCDMDGTAYYAPGGRRCCSPST